MNLHSVQDYRHALSRQVPSNEGEVKEAPLNFPVTPQDCRVTSMAAVVLWGLGSVKHGSPEQSDAEQLA